MSPWFTSISCPTAVVCLCQKRGCTGFPDGGTDSDAAGSEAGFHTPASTACQLGYHPELHPVVTIWFSLSERPIKNVCIKGPWDRSRSWSGKLGGVLDCRGGEMLNSPSGCQGPARMRSECGTVPGEHVPWTRHKILFLPKLWVSRVPRHATCRGGSYESPLHPSLLWRLRFLPES